MQILHLDAYWIFYLGVSEELEAGDAGNVLHGVVKVLSKDLLVLECYQVFVLDPFVNFVQIHAAIFALVPLRAASFKQYANVLLFVVTLTAVK